MLERDLRLVALTGARYHAALVSNRLSLEALRRAKDAGLPVTCGVSINNLTPQRDRRRRLSHLPETEPAAARRGRAARAGRGARRRPDRRHRLRPRSAGRRDQAAAVRGGRGGRDRRRDDAVGGLRLVSSGALSLPRLIRAMTLRPAEILRLPQGRLAVGAPADLIRFDPDAPYVLDPATLHSRCRNTPFDGARLEGRVKLTLVAGNVAHE